MCENKEKLNNKLLNYLYEDKVKSTEDIVELIKNERKDTFLKVMDKNLHYKYQYYPNIISNDICDFIINESEKYAEENKNEENPTGWTKKRHRNYPTTDLPISQIPILSVLVNNIIKYNVLDKIAEKYSVNKYFLDFNDVFIVKYDTITQSSLDKHTDGSAFSFNILLNSPEEFEGGGTIFYENKFDEKSILVSNTKGGLIFHSGQQTHAGNKITKGIRYILVGFVSYLKDVDNNKFKKISNLKELENLDTKINFSSWKINSNNQNDIIELINYIEKINSNEIYLLDTSKNYFNILEKYVYELAMFHFARLNIVFDKNKYYIEYWNKNESRCRENNIIHNFHCDKDELRLQQKNELIYPLLSTVTYLSDSLCPTVITSIPYHLEDKLKIANNDNSMYLSFPKKLKHIAFNGLNLHGVLDIFSENIEKHEIPNRKTFMINLWEKNIPTGRTYKINNNLLDEKYTKNNILIKNKDPNDNYLEKNIEKKLMSNIISNIYNLENNSDNFIKIIDKDYINNYDIINIKI
jgi:predicted 2-oxoglutarate/Fe(II)-dependent dioxygenase YbiX